MKTARPTSESTISPTNDEAIFITFAGTLRAYPGGLRGLAQAASMSCSTLRQVRDTAFAKTPRAHLRKLANATDWDGAPGMGALDADQRSHRLVRLYNRARRYPECGDSVCSQNFIDTGNTACIERSSRRRGLLRLFVG